MSDLLKAALILGAAIVVATSIVTYFSPFHSCIRAHDGEQTRSRAIACARATQ
ncbi:MAG: hypothetical protein OXF27_00335 [Acidobacteria bacterium]|nr:hypothetical protein [Acidobacteriota bacterium]